ncbi:hypothetical protein Pan44_38680 [Caulifigura coniformis]|uniref:Uncharacterized protein n=1 Tax=Caulifigura coniformis TaxID=2527983 RepID=A0A517SI66_9PLAN|nr:DUF5985 family protein [Caulifigura coniformis]QDT55820.1 hypothetical protein Pan44_38680 [Caulifigura coniformis]
MPGVVFLLCMLTSLASGTLLWRAAHGPSRRLLSWSAVFFFGMAVNNAILFGDVIVGPQTDLTMPANIVALISVFALLYALIWEAT